jgi:glycosyltransferase involved in cell wall biosynthesis
MRIAILADDIITGGGAGVVASNHAKELRKKGHEVFVITTTHKKENVGKFTIYSNYNPLFRAYKSLNNPEVVREVGKILAQIKPDVVHAHNIHTHLSYRSLVEARKHAQAVFLTVHDSMPFHYSKLFPSTVDVDGCDVKSYKVSPWKQIVNFKWQFNPFRNFTIKKYLQVPAKIFAVSGALAQALRDNGIGNVEVVHNGIRTLEWRTEQSQNQSPQIFFGGRLSRAKGSDILGEAMQKVISIKPEAKLLLVGEYDGDQGIAKKLGNDHVVSTGWTPHEKMKEVYAKADLVVVPSLCFDWFPTVVLEAMACGKPVIVTCFGGSKEMVVDGVTGFVVNSQTPDELADKILSLLNDPVRAEAMGKAGLERVEKEFSMEKHISTLLAWYDKALKR